MIECCKTLILVLRNIDFSAATLEIRWLIGRKDKNPSLEKNLIKNGASVLLLEWLFMKMK